MTEPRLSTYLDEFEDIPGTQVFNTFRSRQGFNLNQFCMSLMKEENRTAFKANEVDYLKDWTLTAAQHDAVLARDYTAMMREGGNIYFLSKLFSTDGQSYLVAVATMTGMSQADYQQMMLSGGRNPKGVRSKKNPEL
ncbi:MAG: protocatechuate 4,5-dioxygenase subunit alpha [Proteobacteria bacterium]|jgi:protocatechuate 4,5-dioxygenase alpha chain|nr:protocatechuate 4,5-dioxygenase subunit alpha [Pseudomonadota bacterium]MBK9252638.1 protocatechuate 4,5-dioxygenase subunit alpha [Pseudomonadota bacterium]